MDRKTLGFKIRQLVFAVMLVVTSITVLAPAQPVAAAGTLTVSLYKPDGAPLNAYNLIVDSNVKSPSTYAPRVATVIVQFCNTGNADLTNVYGYIGDGTTPGTYPVKTGWAIDPSGQYFYRHVGATSDASRYIGTLTPGQCVHQYWTIEYPACSNVGGVWQEPPCTGTPTWGTSVKPHDDLSLDFKTWGRSDQGGVGAPVTWTMTMRNEISAMANKIQPNGNPAGHWFNTTSPVRVGDVITTNGVLYSLGNVRFGFDNDGDFAPDYNAWLQPISQADYDPTCFRLIRSSGVLTVTRGGGNPTMILPFNDKLYFTNLPPDNTNVRGEVYYTFLALNGPCNVSLSPYQEVASGFDNEKFNGDYGAGIPPIEILKPKVTIDKSSDPDTIALGGTTTYRIPFANLGDANAGLTLSSGGFVDMPLTITDEIPNGMQLAEAATYSLSGGGTATIRYSTDSGATWSTTAPVGSTSTWPNNKIIIRWSLDQPLPKNSTGNYAQFKATVPSGYTGTSFIENTACVGLGDAQPFACAEDLLIVQGTGVIGDFVWRDENNDGQQTGELANGINGVTVSLYWDKNEDGKLDAGDLLLYTQDTFTHSGNAGYYQFTQLPAGKFLVAVDSNDVQVQHPGYRANTPTVYAITLAAGGSNQTADFGFGPSLTIAKRILPAAPGCDGYEGREVTYSIALTNERPGAGETVAGGCRYSVWATTGSTANAPKNYTSYTSAFGEPDNVYASGDFSVGSNRWIKGTGFNPGGSGTITAVEAVFRIYVNPGLVNDFATARLFQGATELGFVNFTTAQINAFTGQANAGYLTWDLSSITPPGGTWTWDDFALLTLHLEPQKQGPADASILYIDAMGFRITASGACPVVDLNDIMTTVPLTDTFNTTRLQFVSADPPHTSVNTTSGLISWNNVGPIYPGETRVVTVRFLALPIAGTSSATVNNSAGSTGTRFADGGYANKVHGTATGTLCQAGNINGTVFSDIGTQGWPYVPGTDLPIPNVRVTLYGCYSLTTDELITEPAPFTNQNCESSQNNGQWRVVSTQVTNAAGFYAFNGLMNGFYYVQVTSADIPGTKTQTAEANDNQTVSGTLPDTTALGGGNNNSTWGVPTANLNTTNFNPINSSGETINGVNFGYNIQPGVYGSVWEDNNGNGSKNTGEGPIGSVTVRLYPNADCSGASFVTTPTDSTGRYQFGNLTAGTQYCIMVDTSTLPGGSSAWTQTGESDGSVNNRITFTAVAGTLSGSHDFGFRKTGPYTIGDTLYYDWNGDGMQQTASEEGIPNVTVHLYEDVNSNGIIDPEDAYIASTVTNGSGFYQFTNLAAGGYLVIVATDDPDFPAGVVQTQDPDESGVCLICNSRGRRTITTSSFDNVDFGYQPRGIGAIGDTVYRDMNGDGVQGGPTETGIAGITVWLEVDLNNDGTFVRVATAITDVNGKYLFENLPDGKYRVVVDHTDTDLPKDAFNHPYTPSTPTTTAQITISGGNTYLNADFGFKPLGAIGDRVWQDNNGNGNQDEGEPGINDVTVGLFTWIDVDGDGVYNVLTDTLSIDPLATRVTSGDGNYLFTGLPAGNYVVKVISGVPAGFSQSGDPDWLVPCTGTDLCDGASGVNLRAGQIDMSRDFGYIPPGVIGDFIWFDADGDGVQDPGEGGIPFVIVQLCQDANCNTVLKTTQTDSDGYYSFGNLNDGTYYVKVDALSLPTGVVITYDLDSGINSPDGITAVTLSGGGSNLTADFGYRYFGDYSISGTTFFDAGNDGGLYVSGTDTPYANITVYLWRDGAIIGTTTTAADGSYTFPNLPNGDYVVSVNRNSPQLSGMTQNTPQPTPYYRAVTIAGSNKENEDFGFHALIDFGDLPDTYGTTVANNGAGHIIGGPRLGATVLPTADGNPTALASGDTDDDGISFVNGPWAADATINFTANVVGPNGYLVGWFDWNGDGKFDESEMVIFGNMSEGNNALSLKIPADASNPYNHIFMRFRLYDKTTLTSISPTGLARGGEVEDYRHSWTPTAVDLIRFEAAPQGTAILITWETAMELDNLGFNLYRSENAAGPWTRVNAELIPAQHPGAVFGAVYEVLDAEVTAGVITYYRLEDVDIFGVSTFHGPISATPTGPTAATVVGFAAQGAPGLGLGLLLVAAFGLTLKRGR